MSYACLKFLLVKEERRKKKEEETRRQNWRFSLRRFSPHGYSNVRLLVFLWTARQCKSICSLVVGFCRLFACSIPWSKTQLFKNSMTIPKYRMLPHSVIGRARLHVDSTCTELLIDFLGVPTVRLAAGCLHSVDDGGCNGGGGLLCFSKEDSSVGLRSVLDVKVQSCAV